RRAVERDEAEVRRPAPPDCRTGRPPRRRDPGGPHPARRARPSRRPAPRCAWTVTSPDLAADRERALALTPVSRETLARLDRFVELLLETQSHTNLIGAATIPTLWTRHIADSLQLLDLAPSAKAWLDLGSGAGFPGIVTACALADAPGAAVHLVESVGKKAG